MRTRPASFARLAVFRGGATLARDRGRHRGRRSSSSNRSSTRASCDVAVGASSCSRRFASSPSTSSSAPMRRRTVRNAHAGYFLEIARECEPQRRQARDPEDSVSTSQSRSRTTSGAALDWARREHSDLELGLRLARRHGAVLGRERSWRGNATTRGGARPRRRRDPAVRAEALRSYGSSVDIAGDGDAAAGLYARELGDLFDELGDEQGRAVFSIASASRRCTTATSSRLASSSSESQTIHERTATRGGSPRRSGRSARSRETRAISTPPATLVAESARLAERSGAMVAVRDAPRARGALARSRQDRGRGREGARRPRARAADARLRRPRLRRRRACLVARARGDPERAGLLWGAIEDDVSVRRSAAGRAIVQHAKHSSRSHEALTLDERARVGRHLSLDDAVALALDGA